MKERKRNYFSIVFIVSLCAYCSISFTVFVISQTHCFEVKFIKKINLLQQENLKDEPQLLRPTNLDYVPLLLYQGEFRYDSFEFQFKQPQEDTIILKPQMVEFYP